MREPQSSYAILGLEPGAGRAAVEEAYRRLIKLHHPDRSGGDAGRAAEINRAYFELRRQDEAALAQAPPAAPPARRYPPTRHRPPRRRKASRGPWLVLLVAIAALAVIGRDRVAEQAQGWVDRLADLQAGVPPPAAGSPVRADSAALDGPLDEAAIGRSIEQAVALARGGGAEALAGYSRDCHRRLRVRPGLEQLDRCAAFDIAVAALPEAGSRGDGGAFSASAVTARQMTAGRLLSSDYLAIERRLDRIRTMVELTLTPRTPLPPLPPVAIDDAGDEVTEPGGA